MLLSPFLPLTSISTASTTRLIRQFAIAPRFSGRWLRQDYDQALVVGPHVVLPAAGGALLQCRPTNFLPKGSYAMPTSTNVGQCQPLPCLACQRRSAR